MKLSELIARLAEMLEEHGDLPTVDRDGNSLTDVAVETSIIAEAIIVR